MPKANQRVREELAKQNMYLWELAVLLGVSEPTITRMMRKELPEQRQNELVELIKKGGKS